MATLVTGLLACAGALVAVPDGVGAAASCPNANLRPNGSNAAAIDAATLCLVDQIRRSYRLRPLRANPELGTVAASQVSSMVHRNYFADVRPTGQTPMALVGTTRYKSHAAVISVGQNIAWGSGGLASPARIVAAWMASPPHRAIMLSGEYHDAGAAVAPELPSVLHAGRRGAVYAIEFGARRF
jgi:uncharacterized protein YkwD